MHIGHMKHPNMHIHPNRIPEMEAVLAQRGISVAELCRRAEVAETTWGRWKKGSVSPTFKTWDSVCAAYVGLTGKKISKGAA